jgi:hypothetical protein
MFNARVRDQWIAPTFERHFSRVTGLNDPIHPRTDPMNNVLSG